MSTTMIVANVISAVVLAYWIISDIRKKRKLRKAAEEAAKIKAAQEYARIAEASGHNEEV